MFVFGVPKLTFTNLREKVGYAKIDFPYFTGVFRIFECLGCFTKIITRNIDSKMMRNVHVNIEMQEG